MVEGRGFKVEECGLIYIQIFFILYLIPDTFHLIPLFYTPVLCHLLPNSHSKAYAFRARLTIISAIVILILPVIPAACLNLFSSFAISK